MSVRGIVLMFPLLMILSSAQTPDLCSIVQPDIGPCTCTNEDGGLKIQCSVDVLGLTVGVAVDSQPCAAQLQASIDVVVGSLNIPLGKIGAGSDDNIPIPGVSVGIGPLSAGFDADVQLDGSLSDASIKIGINACVDVIIGSLCGNDIPGVSSILPVNVLTFSHLDFSSACPPRPEPNLTVPTMEIASGVQMPIISSGAWTTYTTKGNTTAIVSDWLRHGGRAINTALFNGDLRDVAKAIEDTHISRKDIFIATMIPGCDDVQSCIDTELKQLNTSFLDLLLIPSTFGKPFSDAWRTLEENIYHGKLKSIGVSNFNKKQLQEIWHKATIKPAVNQISYNVFRHDEDTIAFCRAHNITIEALSPFGYHDGHLNKKSVFTEPIVLSIAKVHNVTPVQVALKWIVQRGDAVAVLSSNVFPAENADLWKFTLSDDEMTKLDSIASSHGQIQSVESTRMPNQHSLELTVV